MAVYWPTPGYKGRTFKLCVLTRLNFNFCIRSSPLRGNLEKTHHRECSFLWTPSHPIPSGPREEPLQRCSFLRPHPTSSPADLEKTHDRGVAFSDPTPSEPREDPPPRYSFLRPPPHPTHSLPREGPVQRRRFLRPPPHPTHSGPREGPLQRCSFLRPPPTADLDKAHYRDVAFSDPHPTPANPTLSGPREDLLQRCSFLRPQPIPPPADLVKACYRDIAFPDPPPHPQRTLRRPTAEV